MYQDHSICQHWDLGSQGIGNHVPFKDLLAFLTVIKYDRVKPIDLCVDEGQFHF